MSAKLHLALALLFSACILASCKKYLNEKPNGALNIPQTLTDLQLLLDNYGTMNASFPASPEILADNYYLTPSDYNSVTNISLRNYYIWQKEDQYVSEWSTAYRVVFQSNVVLDELERMSYTLAEQSTANNIRGSALFFRGFAFYSLAQLFAPPYDSATAANLPGLPLRLEPAIQKQSVRSSVQQTWQQVLSDFKMALQLLPAASAYSNRPTTCAAYAALARVCLAMQQYNKALYYADSALQLNSTLLDFNNLSTTAAIPIARFSPEIIFPAVSLSPQPLSPSRAKMDSVLYASYLSNDLRKTIYFKSNGNGTFSQKSNWDGSTSGAVFSGLTTSELYLIKAEALARLGLASDAMDVLNSLLSKRFKSGTLIKLTASGADDALAKILMERRKELVFRGQRWTDLRRLNLDQRYAQTLTRKLATETWMLPPNSNRYTLLIPAAVIDLSGMQQNP